MSPSSGEAGYQRNEEAARRDGMIHDSLEGAEFVGRLPRIQCAQRLQDTRGQRLRRKLGAHHQLSPGPDRAWVAGT